MSDIVTPQAPTLPSSQTGPAPMVVPSRTQRKPVGRDRITAMLMLTPSAIAVFLFVYGFIAWNGWASLTDWKGIAPMRQIGPVFLPPAEFTGLDNYAKLFSDSRFQADLRNNAIFTTAFLVGCVVLGLGLAILLDQKIKGESFFRNVFLFPMALSFVVTGTIWRWVFLRDPFAWMTDKNLALPAVIIAAVWQMSGFTMAMFLAGLRSVPDELREAARVDGASEFQVYRRIVLPLINPIILSALIILGHISLKIFDLIYVMAGLGTLGLATDMPSTYAFDLSFNRDLLARGAAASMLILFFVAIVIVPYLITNMKTETEV